MARSLSPYLIGTMLASLGAPAYGNELCDRVAEYEAVDSEGASQPDGLADRWVELHWVGSWLDFDNGFGKTCIHSEDVASRQLCGWLLENSSTEFPQMLPIGILECYGYSFPSPRPSWAGWRASVELTTDRWLTLDIDFTRWEGETGAIRLRAYDEAETPWEDMPPLGPLRGSARPTSASD